MNLFSLFLAVVAGALTAVQTPINGALRTVLGHPLWATIASFAVGLVALLFYASITRTTPPSMSNLAPHPWWYWIGGVCGAFFVTISVILIRELGATVFFSCIIAGQLVTAIFLDHFGLIGVPVHPLSFPRICGAVLLCAGAILIRLF